MKRSSRHLKSVLDARRNLPLKRKSQWSGIKERGIGRYVGEGGLLDYRLRGFSSSSSFHPIFINYLSLLKMQKSPLGRPVSFTLRRNSSSHLIIYEEE